MKLASNKLYGALFAWLNQAGSWRDVRHLQVLVWMVVGVLAEGSVNLTCWIDYTQSRAKYAQSVQRRFSRWLHNNRIQPYRIYAPIVRQVFENWQDRTVYVALDTTLLWNRYCVIRLAVVYRGRAIPLVWRVLEQQSSSVAFWHYRRLLQRAALLLPSSVTVVLLADRGFVHQECLRWLRTTLKWHYHLRLKNCGWFCYQGQWRQLRQIHLARGEALLLGQVRMFKRNSLRGVHLAIARDPLSAQFWAVLSSLPVTLQTLREYGLRFDIEESFLDDKSNGFALESSFVRSTSALSRLLLVLAVATLFLTLQGTAVVDAGVRRQVDPHWQRGMSYLKLGWKWVKQCCVQARQLFTLNRLTTAYDPQPAFASTKQFEQQQFTRQFTVCSPDRIFST
jgi:hypothetical protein